MTIKVAIIGAGAMAREHAKVFSAISTVTLVGVLSRTRLHAQNLASEFGITTVYDSIDELYSKTKADLVIIAVPELAANPVAKQCFIYPWKVLMEKPAGYNLRDSQDILSFANDNNSDVMVGFNRRFYSSVQTVVHNLQSDQGNRYVHIQDQQSYIEARYHQHPEEVVNHFMFANSIHNIDLIRAFCRGSVINVQPIKSWQGELTEVILSHIEFDSGDHALYEGIWKGPGPWACHISTPHCRWSLSPLEVAEKQNFGERQRHPVEVNEVDKVYKPGFYLQAKEVIKRIEGKESRAMTLKDSYATMKLIHHIFFQSQDIAIKV